LTQRIVRSQPATEGVTISGGEPLEQFESVTSLAQNIRIATDLSILLFTGYTWPEVQKMPRADRLLGSLDVLLCGRYDQSRRLAEGLRGSANKTIHFLTDRHTMDELRAVPAAEIMISSEGNLLVTGIDPLVLP
jgi:anaerobic ribonucleoside-triphosphate reductase activating protein